MDKQRSIFARMAAVMAATGAVAKRGEFRGGNVRYDYATASDVKAAIRAAMAANGLAIVPLVKSVEKTEVGGKTTVYATRVWVDFQISSEEGESITVPWYAESAEYQAGSDKGFNKAMTSALKYFLINTFLVPTGDEPDPDAENVEAAPAPKAPAKAKPAYHMTPAQRATEDVQGRALAIADTIAPELWNAPALPEEKADLAGVLGALGFMPETHAEAVTTLLGPTVWKQGGGSLKSAHVEVVLTLLEQEGIGQKIDTIWPTAT